MTLTIAEILSDDDGTIFFNMLKKQWKNGIRVAIPGVIQSFNASEQTVSVQPSVKEKVQDPNTLEFAWTSLPILVDVPIVIPRAGGYALTLPVQQGDECLVIFGDMCIDGWWQNGGTSNNQPDKRRHDLSDGFAILAPTSQPKVLPNYSATSAQLRTEDGSQYIDLSSSGVTIKANVTIDGTLTTTGDANINGISVDTHTHSDPQGGTTGPPE